MKKHFFRMVAALTLVCGVFAFTGCADYESDINSLNDRLDALETGQIADLEEQIATLTGALDEAKNAITALEGSVSDLEAAKEDLQSQIDDLNTRIEENDGDIADLISQVAELEAELARIDGLESDLENLKATVEDIENNYLTKTEAQNTYATLEAVNDLEDALSSIEGRVDNIETVELPTVKAAIEKAQEDASKALGNIDALVKALGGYSEAGTLNKIDELDAVDSTLKANIEALNDSLKANVESLREEIASTKEEILSLVVSKEEFPALVEEQIRKAIEEENGRINQAISDAIKEVTNNLMSQIEDLSDRLEDVEAAMEDLTKRIETAEGEIDDLANRIQSLVFVPEYNDGKATVLSYTIGGTQVSDNMVVTATFKVTPAALAENVINQYNDYVFAEVVTVLTRSAAGPAFIAKAADSTLIIKKGKADGYIDVELTLPKKTEDGQELTAGNMAFSLYVASKEEVEAVVSGDETTVDMDAATYISSEYIQTTADVTPLDGAYVLYNETLKKEYPADGEFAANVNDYEVAWSRLDRKVFFYGTEDKDSTYYTLHIKLDDNYYTLEDAAEIMRADVADITPDYAMTYKSFDRNDSDTDLSEYIEVEEVEPYGAYADMLQSAGMTDVIGSYVLVDNVFSFAADSKFGAVEVLKNDGKYTVINEPVTISLEPKSVDWTYEFALAHADDAANPTKANAKPITEDEWAFTVMNRGEFPIRNVLAHAQPTVKNVYLVDGETETLITENAPVLSLDWTSSVFSEDEENGTLNIEVSDYDFSDSVANVYRFEYVYDIEQLMTECTVEFTLTLGQMPGNIFVNYNQLPEPIDFMLPGSGLIDFIGVDNGYKMAFAQVSGKNPAWFTGIEQFTEALQLNDKTLYTTLRDGVSLYDKAERTDATPVHTRLAIEPDAENTADSESYVRVSSSQVTAVGNVFDFTTEITTWFGVTYTFTNEGIVAEPEYELSYIPTHIYDLGSENPYVQLKYHLSDNNIYVIDEANLRNYFEVTGIPLDFNGELTVKFEVLTQENPAEGYANVPTIPVLNVNNQNGQLGEYTIDWSRYTARDIQIRATLVGSGNTQVSEEIEINSLDLTIQVDALVAGAAMKGAEDLDYFGNNFELTNHENEDYIVINRENGETVNINLWEYVKAFANTEFGDGENFIPYGNASGVRHNSLVYVNSNAAMLMYGAELVFDKDIDVVSGGIRRDIEYNNTTGIVTYKAEDGKIANPLYITVEGHLNYYLDYNHVESYPVTVKVMLQDAE